MFILLINKLIGLICLCAVWFFYKDVREAPGYAAKLLYVLGMVIAAAGAWGWLFTDFSSIIDFSITKG